MNFRRLFSLSLFVVLLAALLGLGSMPVAHAARHSTAASTATLNGTYVTVNNGPGNHTDPHVSGDWVSYTDDSTGGFVVRYHNLVTGADVAIPDSNGQDDLSGISGTTVVYMHATGAGQDIYRYDIGSSSGPVALSTQPGELLYSPAIGNRTVAWINYSIDPNHPQVVVYNLDTKVATTLTSDTTFINYQPAVSPDGSVVVWQKCTGTNQFGPNGCNIWQAVLSGGTWNVSQLTSDSADELPHTDGHVVVYDSQRTVNGTAIQGVYWQPVGGGNEQQVPFPAGTTISQNAHISDNLISFQNFDTTASSPNWNVWVYSLATQTLYQITNGLANETLSDISVASDGTAHVVWNAQENDFHVYGFLFKAPTADAPLTITRLVAGANEEGQAGLAATFTDADPKGKVSDYAATISWGDGSTSKGSVMKNPQGAGFVVVAAHQYAKAGTYTLTLTIHDSGGSSVTASKTLVVPPDRD